MDFSELPVRLVNKSILIILSAVLIIQFCNGIRRYKNESLTLVEKGDQSLIQKGPTLFYNNEPFTGMIYTVSERSDTLSKEFFRNGKEDGASLVWDNLGNKIEERQYKNGKRVGIHKGWHSSGQLKFRYEYKDDLMHGLAEEWFASGDKFREMHYVNGKEEGMQRMWSEDGSIRANYEARNGRNYGLTGIKSCKNIWNNVSL